MEAREEVESTDDPERLRHLMQASAQRVAQYVQAVRAAFAAADYNAAAEAATRLRYVSGIQEAARHKL